MIPNYIDALCQEIEKVADKFRTVNSVDTVYFGGGTPSLLSIPQFETILSKLQNSMIFDNDVEITLEANPGSVNKAYLQELRGLGFTRISFGMQSDNPQDLAILDRQHNYYDILHAIEWSNTAGFEHINLDLIFGIPGQTLERWKQNLKLVQQMEIDHLSLYSLTFESGTLLDHWYQRGILDLVDDDAVADMYQYAIDHLKQNGFFQYEISNWARKKEKCNDARSQHNLNTWRYHPYFGFGAGAHGFINGTRTANTKEIAAYINQIKQGSNAWPAAESVIDLGVWDQMQEFMMVGLRLVDEGVSKKDFMNRFNYSMEGIFSTQFKEMTQKGLLQETPNDRDRLRLTERGVMMANRVFMEFIGNPKPDWIDAGQ